jgi:hypothetical protein
MCQICEKQILDINNKPLVDLYYNEDQETFGESLNLG